jgi:NADPH2:quinone reductase
MRALLCKEFGPPEKLVIEEIPDPVPGRGEVVIEVRTAGFNFPDLLIIQGKYQFTPQLPFSPGGEVAGRVAAIGEGVKGFQLGDRVTATTIFGGFAEKLRVSAGQVTPLPQSVPYEVGAGFTIAYGTSYHALKQRARLIKGESLLVLGAAGGVGLAAVEIGKAMGAMVIAAASSDEKLETAREHGADEGINYSNEDLKTRAKALSGGGLDVVYDPVGGEYSEAALRSLARGGRHLVIGFAAGDIPSIPLNLTLLKECQIVGVFWGAWAMRNPKDQAQNMAELTALYDSGAIKPLISQTYALEDYLAAFERLAGRQVQGKLILKLEPQD